MMVMMARAGHDSLLARVTKGLQFAGHMMRLITVINRKLGIVTYVDRPPLSEAICV